MLIDSKTQGELVELLWAYARTNVMHLGVEDRPFSRYDAGIGLEASKAAHLATIAAAKAFREALEVEERTSVVSAIRAGATFVELGDAVGITRQAARKRFA